MGAKKKNKENDIIISCLGTSQEEVTGSCWSISYPKDSGEKGLIIIECGLSQSGNTPEKQYAMNKKIVDNIGKEMIQSAEYVFLGHAHCDHIANLPIFNDDNGFKGKILASPITIEIGKELIMDSIYIHNRNMEFMKSKGGKQKPLYTEAQMQQMFEHMQGVEVGKRIELNDNLSVTFFTNSHVIGATSIFIEIRKPNNSVKTILYSSDMGSEINKDLQPYLSDNNIPSKCNLFISEATYSSSERQFNRKEAIKEREDLKALLKESVLNNKRVLFATFSFSRAQLLMTMIYNWFKDEEWFKDIPVVIDGVLVNKINASYLKVLKGEDKSQIEDVLHWRNVKYNKSYEGTIATLSKHTPGIYLASSGFCGNGRIITYLQQFLGNSKDVIVLTGFAGGIGTTGYKISNPEQKTVTIEKRVITKRAKIQQLKTFSSHISHSELLDLYKNMRCDKILVHHCSQEYKYKFCEEAKAYLMSKGITTKIVPVDKASNQFVL